MLRITPDDTTQPTSVQPGPSVARGPSAVGIGFPPGHYYSPIPDDRELRVEPRFSQVWPPEPHRSPGIDWREAEQLELCRELFGKQSRLHFPLTATPSPSDYFIDNGAYPAPDAWILEGMLRGLRPKRMIEIGSGYSSLVTARLNRQDLGYDLTFTCIEPNPLPFLVDGVAGIDDLIVSKVQDVPLELFSELGDGDVLFIDSSHVVKTGGDVPWIYLQILPRLAPGVYIHVHDIFLPHDYPKDWVLNKARGWNEQYLLEGMLTFSAGLEVVFASSWMATHHEEEFKAAFPGYVVEPGWEGMVGSFWMRRAGGSARPSAEPA